MGFDLPDRDVEHGSWEDVRSAVQRNFVAVAESIPSTGGQRAEIRFGLQTVTWPGGSQTSNVATVSHGLDTTPAAVIATMSTGTGAFYSVAVAVNYTATTFDLRLDTVDASTPLVTATSTVAWFAIG
jgi:hypothetical protein